MTEPISFRIRVLLSFQRALWDTATPALRGVAVRTTEPVIEPQFLYEHEPTEDEIELVSLVETYVIADLLPRPALASRLLLSCHRHHEIFSPEKSGSTFATNL